MMRRGRIYWAAAESHFYSEPKRLEALGFLTSPKEPGKTRQRTHYLITEKGREALRAWLGEPSTLPRIQHEAVVRLLATHSGDEQLLLRSLNAMREDIADAGARLDLAEAVASTLPERERYLRLVHRLGRALLQTHLAWLDQVERELDGERR